MQECYIHKKLFHAFCPDCMIIKTAHKQESYETLYGAGPTDSYYPPGEFKLTSNEPDMVNSPSLKHCGYCNKDLPLDAFAKNKVKKDGLQERCKACRSIHHKEKGHVSHRERNLRVNYGVDSSWYDAKLESQDGCCAICGTDDNGKRRFAVDHDHSTGIVRGLLCDTCNRALGMFADSATILEKAAAYLKEHKE